MSADDHWIYQGRQSHGWFGTGTAPKDGAQDDAAETNPLFRPANAGLRVDSAAHTFIAYIPWRERGRWGGFVSSDVGRDRLKTAVAAWYGSSALSREAFRARFLDPYTSDETVDQLRRAARGMVEARDFDVQGKATADLAAAIQQIGPDRWPRFIGDAAWKAEEAVSQGDVPGVIKADAGTDALGIALGAVLIVGGIAYAIHNLPHGGQPSRQQTSGSPERPSVMQVVPPEPKKEAESSASKPDEDGDTSIAAPENAATKDYQYNLPASPDDLLKNGWIETTHPSAAGVGHREFENPQTGQKIEFDKGRSGEPGFRDVDHYHIKNPAKTGKRDAYLDIDGNAVPNHSTKSHILPGGV